MAFANLFNCVTKKNMKMILLTIAIAAAIKAVLKKKKKGRCHLKMT